MFDGERTMASARNQLAFHDSWHRRAFRSMLTRSMKSSHSRNTPPTPKRTKVRRQPHQDRARQTVAAVLDATVRVLKRHGIEGVTTNRIAEVAGVSIGSVYQYFPDKRAIFAALHDRHADEMGRLVERSVLEHGASTLETWVRALVEALVDAHTSDPELVQLLANEVPHGARGAKELESRMRRAFRLALAARSDDLPRGSDLERMLFTAPIVLDAMAHGVSTSRPPHLSIAAAKEEAVQTVMRCLR
jgi:AcrR family transcriptional regulator